MVTAPCTNVPVRPEVTDACATPAAAPTGNGSDATLTGCVACQNAPVTAIVGAVPMFTVGVAANAGKVPVMPKPVLVIDPIAFVPADRPTFHVPDCVTAPPEPPPQPVPQLNVGVPLIVTAPMVLLPVGSAGNVPTVRLGAVPILTVGVAANAGSDPVMAAGTGLPEPTCAPCTYRFEQGTSTEPVADATLQRLCKLPLPSLTVIAPCDCANAGTLAETISAIVNGLNTLRIVVTYIALCRALFEGSEKSNWLPTDKQDPPLPPTPSRSIPPELPHRVALVVKNSSAIEL